MSDECIIQDSSGRSITVAIREQKNGIYKLNGNTIPNCSIILGCSLEQDLSCTKEQLLTATIWHERLGHYHYQGLR